MNIADSIVNEVIVETSAAASSGGASASSGGTTVTGDSSASVNVTNVINGSNSGGTSHTIIEKTVDGVTTREEEVKHFAPGEPIQTSTHVEAVSGGASSASSAESNTQSEEGGEATTTTTEASATSSSPIEVAQSLGGYIIDTVSGFFSNIFSFFR